MPNIRALCLLLAGALVVAGQEPNPGPQKSNEKPSDLCGVEGVIIKSTTGEGIKRITVQLSSIGAAQQSYSTLTEGGGRFIIRDIAPGRYLITALGNGYLQQASEKGKGSIQTRILDLTPGRSVTGITIRMVPPGVIIGTVYDEDGDPVTRAQVRALRVVGFGVQRKFGGGDSVQTNDLGEYRIWGLQPGKYLVAASYQPPQSNQAQPTDEVYLPTFHPSTPDTSQASVVEVVPGAETSGIDVDLRQAHAVMVRGRVMVDAPVRSLRGIHVSLMPRASEGGYSLADYGGSVQSDSGDFEIRGVPPGPYNLIAFWNDGRRQLGARVPVEVSSANLEAITLVLGSPITLTGRIRVESGNPFDFTRLGLMLQPIDGGMGAGNAQIKPDGTFVVPNVFDGSFRVRVLGYPDEYYVKSVRAGGSEVLDSGLTVSHSQSQAPLEVVLCPDGGRVEGTVLKEQVPVGRAWVVLAPGLSHRERSEMYSMKETDVLGRFSLVGLPPGDYTLFAWEPVQGTNYFDPDFFEAFEGLGKPIHVGEGQQQAVQLELITAEEQLR